VVRDAGPPKPLTTTATTNTSAAGAGPAGTGTAGASAAGTGSAGSSSAVEQPVAVASAPEKPAEPVATGTRRRRSRSGSQAEAPEAVAEPAVAEPAAEATDAAPARRTRRSAAMPAPVLFVAPEATAAAAAAAAAETADVAEEPTRTRSRTRSKAARPAAEEPPAEAVEEPAETADEEDDDEAGEGKHRRRRGRRGRGRGKGAADEADESTDDEQADQPAEAAQADDAESGDGRRRRRRRRRGSSGSDEPQPDDPPNTVVKVREPRKAVDEVQGVSGSTRLEAKRQRRRDGRDQRRTRPPILSESEFLARREAVDRSMVVRQIGDRTQIAVLEDGVLVEHYVAQASNTTMVGSVYLGKVQNVLPSMEAAFIDIGRGRNAVLYAGEVNWDSAGLEGRTRAIEKALKPGDSVLVQVTKDPIGHKGARLTSHVTLSGRHLVYVPGGHASGISRKLPDTERKRLRDILKKLVPEEAGVIVRTAAEGASADDLSRDVARLTALWETIQEQAKSASAPAALYEEPDLVIRVVRDLFNEDFSELNVSGDDAATMVEEYVAHVSPDLVGRVRRHAGPADVFAELRIDEQLMKALDRKVYLPSGGSLVIDRTEAMTVIDVNTGKFIGSGGNLEETVTRNNLEAAEEIVRQLRLRDVGGIIVIDFIDMVLESNRELVLRRLTECLGRDRTKHQVTEITSLGLVQMTRKRLGQPLIDAFSETCEHCKGRGVIIHLEPTGAAPSSNGHKPEGKAEGRRRGRKAKGDKADKAADPAEPAAESPAEDADAAPADESEPRRRRSGGRRRATVDA
jgi:ribonuclease E